MLLSHFSSFLEIKSAFNLIGGMELFPYNKERPQTIDFIETGKVKVSSIKRHHVKRKLFKDSIVSDGVRLRKDLPVDITFSKAEKNDFLAWATVISVSSLRLLQPSSCPNIRTSKWLQWVRDHPLVRSLYLTAKRSKYLFGRNLVICAKTY